MKQIIVLVCVLAAVVCDMDKMLDFKKQTNKVCQDKTNVSNEVLDSLKAGNLPDGNKDLKCYISCIMEQMKTMKDGKFDLAAATQMIDTKLPEQYREGATKIMTACTGKFDSLTDPCELAWEMTKCWKGEMAKVKKNA